MTDVVEILTPPDGYADLDTVIVSAGELRGAIAHIERLRAALEMFACDCMDGGTPCSKPESCRNYIARAALETREAGVSLGGK